VLPKIITGGLDVLMVEVQLLATPIVLYQKELKVLPKQFLNIII